MRRFSLLLLLVLVSVLISVPLTAQETDEHDLTDAYPTLAILQETSLPPADSVDLAQRLRGVGEITLPEPTSNLPVGTVQMLEVTNSSEMTTFEVEAVLRAVGDHIYIWIENDLPYDEAGVQQIAADFDADVYEQVRELWGSEPNPGVDGDPRVHALWATNLGAFTGAYFARRHTFPEEVFPGSNEREMFVMNYNAFGANGSSSQLQSVLAHEFQHMIRNNLDANEDTWMNEGFSTFTEAYLGLSNNGFLSSAFWGNPAQQLNTFGESGAPRAEDYGAGFTFMAYFYQRFGIEAVRELSADPANGLIAVDNVLRDLDEGNVNEFFADWVIANLVQDTTVAGGLYGYDLIGGQSAQISSNITGYPTIMNAQLAQYATNYFALDALSGGETLDISLTMPQTVGLVATDAFSGERMWYSNRGDVSNSRLTRAFNLSDVDSAKLSYQVWYDIEEGWDYVYVSASADGGATWDILPATSTTDLDPHGNAYGVAYTGASGGWIEETVILDAYAGDEVLIRFELVADDAVNLQNLVIDDITLPELGYFTDLESDDGGWQSEGWLLIDNRLPQQAWVQVVQYLNGDVTVTRWLADSETTDFSIDLEPNVNRVVLAVSPFAPVTTIGTDYRLEVARQ